MRFRVVFSYGAEADLEFYEVFERRGIVDGIKVHLSFDANVESNRRKMLSGSLLAPWELRIGDFRVFYTVESEAVVRIISIGHKEHDKLFIRGERVEL
jgi:mRNA-degrading endonuclease RelE of RelBE toxin-antitoxin system